MSSGNHDLGGPDGQPALAASPSSPVPGLAPTGFDQAQGSLEAAHEALRSLASYVGAGGYNAPSVDPEVFEAKVRWGVNNLINATVQRCADVIEEQSKNYARATWGSARRAILDLKLEDATEGAEEFRDQRIAEAFGELEHRAVSAKGGELYCELCKKLVGEDGTLHPLSCPLSYGYDHLRTASARVVEQSK